MQIGIIGLGRMGANIARRLMRGGHQVAAFDADAAACMVGPSGAGHFTKMIHNGIEYGLMQAYAEGFAILDKKEELGIDLAQVSRIWQHGSVVRSWLLELVGRALADNPGLEGIAPFVEDSGEGR